MIDMLQIEGFKRFESQPFRFAPLTVLAGLNGAGKTTLIHALLLLRETSRLGGSGVVQLNGPYGLDLGTAEDILNWNASELVLTAKDSGGVSRFAFDKAGGEEMYLSVSHTTPYVCSAFSPVPGAFTYLSAERFGPRSSVRANSLPVEQLEVGVWGENSAQILEARGGKPANPARLHPSSEGSPLLKYELERWMSEIARPVEISAERYAGSTVCALSFRSPGGTYVRSTNMGFGVSYALPVVLAGLIARDGGLLIVENPEAHLHPAGQSRMGFFLAWLAATGVQVVLETHSDHVINGIRRAIGEFDALSADSAIVHYFSLDDGVAPQELHFNSRGGISDWPKGFFDQYVIDTAALGQIRRRSKLEDVVRN